MFHVLVVYVDDFIIFCPTEAMAWYVFWALRIVLRQFGFTVNMRAHKCIAPCQIIDFLGVTLDSVAMKARLSPAKLAALADLILATLLRHSITRKELDKFNGKLNWVCKVVYGGRTFLRRFIDAQWSVKRPHHHIRLSASIRLDLEWWQQFCPSLMVKQSLFLANLSRSMMFPLMRLPVLAMGLLSSVVISRCCLLKLRHNFLMHRIHPSLSTYMSYMRFSFRANYLRLPCGACTSDCILTIPLLLQSSTKELPRAPLART
jgi:hypothetical protein